MRDRISRDHDPLPEHRSRRILARPARRPLVRYRLPCRHVRDSHCIGIVGRMKHKSIYEIQWKTVYKATTLVYVRYKTAYRVGFYHYMKVGSSYPRLYQTYYIP